MDLPKLDFSSFLQGTKDQQAKLADELVKSFKNHGFVTLINHGIPEQTVKSFLSETKKLFALPPSAKMKFQNIKGPKPQRGWSSKGAEVTAKLYEGNIKDGNGDSLKDEREFFDAGPPDDCQYPNRWPSEELPELQFFMEKCYALLQETSLQIIRAVEMGLGMEKNTLINTCIPAASEIRLNHYPPVSIEELNQGFVKRTWPHTDFGIITLLLQDGVGGLEMEDRSHPGSFVPVMPGRSEDSSELVVNISDTFQRWTNGVIRAGLHRVDVPPGMRDQKGGICPDRYSSIFFFKAARDTSVGALPAFVTPDRPSMYDSITALEFQRNRTSVLY